MNIVERVQQLQSDVAATDKNFKKLKNALDEYHCLIHEGKLIPRRNNAENIYTVHSFKSNIDM